MSVDNDVEKERKERKERKKKRETKREKERKRETEVMHSLSFRIG